MLAKSVALVALLGALLALADPSVTYPHCNTDGDTSKCCSLGGDRKMSHHGYFLASLNGNATVVTCKAGKLECHLGNPGQAATSEKYADVDCPDFKAIFESRSGLEVLEGVVYSPEAEVKDTKPGQVKPADT